MSHPFQEHEHRVHDYRHLARRWKSIARSAGLKLGELARAGEYPVHVLETPGAADDPATLYLSAGIHGDEPAAAEGLACWAERHLPRFTRGRRPPPLLILPCLNPWGLVNNQRADARGRDLNRLFDRRNLSPIAQIRRLVQGRRFSLTINLHEDYDARGVYLYELSRRPPDIGADLLKSVSEIIPLETRTRIDGRPAKNGLMLRRANLQRIPLHPEAIYLYLNQCDRSLTFETPSEFALDRRVEAHVRALEFSLDWLGRNRAAAPPATPRSRR